MARLESRRGYLARVMHGAGALVEATNSNPFGAGRSGGGGAGSRPTEWQAPVVTQHSRVHYNNPKSEMRA
eukprot:scaffold2354_cov124-Isochrysis_galbana.AAC.2